MLREGQTRPTTRLSGSAASMRSPARSRGTGQGRRCGARGTRGSLEFARWPTGVASEVRLLHGTTRGLQVRSHSEPDDDPADAQDLRVRICTPEGEEQDRGSHNRGDQVQEETAALSPNDE